MAQRLFVAVLIDPDRYSLRLKTKRTAHAEAGSFCYQLFNALEIGRCLGTAQLIFQKIFAVAIPCIAWQHSFFLKRIV
jgi:hypothetical protein